MRLGVFGGTFNPVHLAHLRCAEEAREALRLERVLFVPAANPPHKGAAGVAGAVHRLAMLRLAVRGNRAFRVSPLEVERGGRSYSVDTLRQLRARLPGSTRLVFLLGVDQFREIATWRGYRDLFSLAEFGVMTRPPHVIAAPRALIPVAARGEFCYGPDRTTLRHRSGNTITFLTVTALDISASAIRERLARGESVRYLVPPAVERYIDRHGLYR